MTRREILARYRHLRQISKEKEREVSNPAWTPDGQYLVNRKHFRNTRSLGAGEISES